MNEAPSHAMLLALGEDLGWPSVTIGVLKILGADAWRDALARTAPIERRTWLQALAEPLLNATPHARERLEAWRRSPVRTSLTPERILEHLLFYGDAPMLDPVVAAFVCMPEPVRAYVLGECAFLAVGAVTRGWVASSNFVDINGAGRNRIIVLSGADRSAAELMGTTLHEAAHAWTTPTPSMPMMVQGEIGFQAYAKEQGLTERFNLMAEFDERLACALAAVWQAQLPEERAFRRGR